MLYREIVAVFPQIHIKHTNTLCGQNVQLLNVKVLVQWAVELWERSFYPVLYICGTERQNLSPKGNSGKGSSPR